MTSWILTHMSSLERKSPSKGCSGSYSWFSYTRTGHWSPLTVITPFTRFERTLQWKSEVSKDSRVNATNCGSFQLMPAGQRSKPVMGWWNPWLDLMFWESGGFSGTPQGVIYSMTAPFNPFMSSALALKTPFWIYEGYQCLTWMKLLYTPTHSDILPISSSKESAICSIRPRTMARSFLKRQSSLRCLCNRGISN